MKKIRTILSRSLFSLGVLAVSTALSLGASELGIGKESIIMIFLLGVLVTIDITHGYIYGMISSFFSILIFNFLFTEPIYSFVINSPGDVILLAFFEETAIVAGSITSRLDHQIELSQENEHTSQMLARISAGFMNLTGNDEIAVHATKLLQEDLGVESRVVLLGHGAPDLGMSPSEGFIIKDFPLKNNEGPLGILRIQFPVGGLKKPDELILRTVINQLEMALERESIYQERETIRIAMEREQLRSTLLRSVAHDLRSPLTVLSGASNLLADDFDRLTIEERKKLAGDISEEMIWLSDFVENILSMTRINEDKLVVKKEEEVVDDIVGEAVTHMKRLVRERDFQVVLPEEVVTVPMDAPLIVQVLVNLLDNAVKHTRPEETIRMTVEKNGKNVRFLVADEGSGIDDAVRDRLFEGFVASNQGVSDGRRGIGLGLAICKTIIKAHGGKIWAEPNQPKGSRFLFTLPQEDPR